MIIVAYRVFSHGDGPLAAAHLFGVSLHAHLLASLGSGGARVVFGAVLAVLADIAWGSARRAGIAVTGSAIPDNAGPRAVWRRDAFFADSRRHARLSVRVALPSYGNLG
jgi:hypothetical protein